MDEERIHFKVTMRTLATVASLIGLVASFALYIIRSEASKEVFEVSVRVAVLENTIRETKENMKEIKGDLQYIRGRLDGFTVGSQTTVVVPTQKLPAPPKQPLFNR